MYLHTYSSIELWSIIFGLLLGNVGRRGNGLPKKLKEHRIGIEKYF